MLTIIKPFQKTLHSRTQSPCFESGFVYFESGFSKVQVRVLLNTSPDFFRVRVRVFLESGFSSSPSPGPSPVRVSKYAVSIPMIFVSAIFARLSRQMTRATLTAKMALTAKMRDCSPFMVWITLTAKMAANACS